MFDADRRDNDTRESLRHMDIRDERERVFERTVRNGDDDVWRNRADGDSMRVELSQGYGDRRSESVLSCGGVFDAFNDRIIAERCDQDWPNLGAATDVLVDERIILRDENHSRKLVSVNTNDREFGTSNGRTKYRDNAGDFAAVATGLRSAQKPIGGSESQVRESSMINGDSMRNCQDIASKGNTRLTLSEKLPVGTNDEVFKMSIRRGDEAPSENLRIDTENVSRFESRWRAATEGETIGYHSQSKPCVNDGEHLELRDMRDTGSVLYSQVNMVENHLSKP